MFEPVRIGRYVVGRELAAGGMASVYLGRMSGPAGFGKSVAIKRMHSQFAKDAEFISMFLDEARITSGLTHPNIVMTLDVLEQPGDLLLVMEYVHGGSLAAIMKAAAGQGARTVPPAIASAVVVGALAGLHAAHEARSDDGVSLHIIHRDVSPQNILVSADGMAKIADFGIAKAVGQIHSTSEGVTKGKQSYMAPEQAVGEAVTPRADVFAAGVVLWEALVGKRLISGASGVERLNALLNLQAPPPSSLNPAIPPALDAVVLCALARDPNARFPTANAMAVALEQAMPPAGTREVGEWVRGAIANDLADRDAKLAELHRWCRNEAPDAPPSNRDSGHHFITTPLPLPVAAMGGGGHTAILPANTHEAVKSETKIATERDVFTGHAPVPPKRNTALLVIAIVLMLSVVGGGVAVIAVLKLRATPRPIAVVATTASVAESPPPPPPATVSQEPVALVVDAGAPPVASVVAAVAPKPTAVKPVAPAKPAGPCRIVPQKDAAGHTVFREVCTP